MQRQPVVVRTAIQQLYRCVRLNLVQRIAGLRGGGVEGHAGPARILQLARYSGDRGLLREQAGDLGDVGPELIGALRVEVEVKVIQQVLRVRPRLIAEDVAVSLTCENAQLRPDIE